MRTFAPLCVLAALFASSTAFAQNATWTMPQNKRSYASTYPPPSTYTYPPQGQPAPVTADKPTEAKRAEKSVAFDVTAGTVFPLGIGPELLLEVPGRIQLRGNVLWMPGAYASAIGGIARAAAGDSVVAPLVTEALSSSLAFQAGLGWRPFKDHGFEVGGGYTGVKLRGSASPQQIGDVVGGDVGAQIPQVLKDDVSFNTMLHNFHVTAGWRWVPVDHLVIRAFVGYSQTVASKTSISIPGYADVEAQAQPIVDQEVNKIVTTYVKLPLIGLTLGARF
jgi:hypothetical protein